MFITFEGLDGSGKTTTIGKLAQELHKKFPELNLVLTREPGGDKVPEAERIREIILDKASDLSDMAEALLYTTSRRIHLEKVVWPSLKEKKFVICDRYIDSFYAYQGYARGLDLDFIKQITTLVIQDAIPDLTFFMEFTPQEAHKRREETRLVKDRMENEKMAFHEKVYAGYKELIKQDPERFILIDASKTMQEVLEEVFDKLTNHPKFKEYCNKYVKSQSN